MRLRFIYVLMFFLFGLIVLQSLSTGPASGNLGDRTGSPISNNGSGTGQCGNCHSGAINNTALTVTVKDGNGAAVTSYTPGASYNIEFAVTSSSGFLYGFQGVVLTSSNTQAGSFGTPVTSTTTKVTNLSGIQYAEHSMRATTSNPSPNLGYTFIVPWTAPSAGTGTVTVYSDAVTVNGAGTQGDDPAGPVSVALTEAVGASIDYSSASYCQNGSDPTPSITGIQGGTFSSTMGLSINPNTGVIDVSQSTPGAYTISYNYGSGTATDNVTILAADNPAFSYSKSTYCTNDANPTPSITGTQGGLFGATPAGLSINQNTGQINIGSSTLGTYTVSYVTTGTCSATGTTSITISNLDNAGFSYSSSSYCQNGTDPSPTISGVQGGTFSSTNGLSINPNTGAIDVSASTAATYQVTYTTNGPCPNSSNISITINAADNAGFSYSSSSYCQNGTDPSPTISGLQGGTFSSTNGLSINPNTGAIDVSASTAGAYQVTYTTNGSCPNSSNVSITISATDNAGFSYSSSTYCQNGADPSPSISGLIGGTFSSTNGLSLNPNTGEIDLSASTAGNYQITYTTNGNCPNSSNVSVTINVADNAGFSYSSSSYCQNGTDPSPSISGLQGGTFSSTTGLSLNPNTGAIDVSASTAGAYQVTYTTNGTCPNSSSVPVTINAADNAGFSYGSSSYCQNGTDPSPTISGLQGGTFSSNTGLSINPNTGVIDLSASGTGNHQVTYTTNGSCPNSSSVSVTINAADDASFSYSNASYCQNGTDASPTISGLQGGTFSSTAGLSINANTGVIDVSASTAGAYQVTYTTNGSCPNSSSIPVTINAADDASFTYGGATFCQNGNDPVPTVTQSGGVFSSTPSGLVMNSNGLIDVSASTVGNYMVIYTLSGTCPDSDTVSVTIAATGNAGFNYGSATYCQNAANPSPTITGSPGGTFTSTTGLDIDASTGAINLANSTLGTYVITYTVTGACASSDTSSVTILAADVASYAYTDTTICLNAGANPVLSVTGNTTGTYAASPTGLVFANNATGEVDLSASSAGNYVITYTSNNPNCPAIVTVNVDLTICGNVSLLNKADAYKLYPNPNEGNFTIENNGLEGDLDIIIRDVFGKVVYQEQTYVGQEGRHALNVPNLESGLYWVELQKANEVSTLKMIISE